MPHSLFLGSALATQDRLSSNPSKALLPSPTISIDSLEPANKTVSYLRRLFLTARNSIVSALHVRQETENHPKPKCHADRDNNTLAFVKAHLYHGIIDMAISLLGIAVSINALYVSFVKRFADKNS